MEGDYIADDEYGFDYGREGPEKGDYDEDYDEGQAYDDYDEGQEEVEPAEGFEEGEEERGPEIGEGDDGEYGFSFKDLERGGKGGDERLMDDEDYIIRNMMIILTSDPFNIKVSGKEKEMFKDIPGLKIRNPFMLACLVAWSKEGYLEREGDLTKFYNTYAKGHPKKEFFIDFIRYLSFSKSLKK